MEEKKKPIAAITIVKQTFVVGKEVVPGQVMRVPADVTDVDARVLIAQGQAIEGDGSGVAAPFVARQVEKHEAAVRTRSELRDKLKPVSNRELLEAQLQTQQMITELLGKMGDLMFVEPEPAAVVPAAAPAVTTTDVTTEAKGSDKNRK